MAPLAKRWGSPISVRALGECSWVRSRVSWPGLLREGLFQILGVGGLGLLAAGDGLFELSGWVGDRFGSTAAPPTSTTWRPFAAPTTGSCRNTTGNWHNLATDGKPAPAPDRPASPPDRRQNQGRPRRITLPNPNMQSVAKDPDKFQREPTWSVVKAVRATPTGPPIGQIIRGWTILNRAERSNGRLKSAAPPGRSSVPSRVASGGKPHASGNR